MNIKQKLEEILREKDWDFEQRFKLTRNPDRHIISASISHLEDWFMRINLDPEFEKKIGEIISKIYKKNLFIDEHDIENNAESLLYESITHEKGHNNKQGQSLKHLTDKPISYFNPVGCPGTLDYVAMIVSSVTKGLKKAVDKDGKQYFPEVSYDLAFDISNIFSDILVNTCAAIGDKNHEKFKEGRFLCYAKEGIISEFDDLYSIFVDTQMNMYMDKSLHRKCAKRYSKKGFPKLREVSKKAIKILTSSEELSDKLTTGLPSKEDKVMIYEEMCNIGSWMQKAEDFAELIAPYITEPIRIPLTYLFKLLKGDIKFQRKVIAKCLEKGYDTSWADKYNLIDEFLKKRACEIVTKYFDFEQEDSRTPIAYLKSRKYSCGDLVKSQSTNWMKTRIYKTNGNNKIELYKKEFPIEAESPREPSIKRLRDFGTIGDASGSMKYNILKWVDEGKNLSQMKDSDFGEYDLWLLGKWACLNYLERIRKASTIKYNTLLYSSKCDLSRFPFEIIKTPATKTSGWKSYWDIDEVKKIDILGYVGGSTDINIEMLDDYVRNARGNCFTIFGTDGCFDNDNIKNNVIERMKKHSQTTCCVLFNIGAGTDETFSTKFSEFGSVKSVEKPSDYIDLILEQVHERFGK